MKIQAVIELYDPEEDSFIIEEEINCCTMCVFNEAEQECPNDCGNRLAYYRVVSYEEAVSKV